MLEREVAGKKMAFTLIWISMMLACVIYFIIPEFIPLTETDTPEPLMIIKEIRIALSAVMFIAGTVMIWNKACCSRSGENSWRFLERAQKYFIIGLAFYEMIAIFGLVTYFLGFPEDYKYFMALSFVMIACAGSKISPIFSHYQSLKELENVSGRG